MIGQFLAAYDSIVEPAYALCRRSPIAIISSSLFHPRPCSITDLRILRRRLQLATTAAALVWREWWEVRDRSGGNSKRFQFVSHLRAFGDYDRFNGIVDNFLGFPFLTSDGRHTIVRSLICMPCVRPHRHRFSMSKLFIDFGILLVTLNNLHHNDDGEFERVYFFTTTAIFLFLRWWKSASSKGGFSCRLAAVYVSRYIISYNSWLSWIEIIRDFRALDDLFRVLEWILSRNRVYKMAGREVHTCTERNGEWDRGNWIKSFPWQFKWF